MSRVHSPSAHPHRAAGPAVLDLIDRLEKAAAGSRELDGAVWYAVFEPDVDHGCLHVEQTEQGPREVLTCELGSKWADDVGHYTTCLDAALALAEWVGLDGWNSLYAAMMSWKAHDPRGPVSRTLPLALCIAVLRATTPAEADAVGTDGRNATGSAPLQSPETPEGRDNTRGNQ